MRRTTELRILIALLLSTLPVVAAAQEVTLPEGEAKDGLKAMCVSCHQLGRVTNMHLSRDDWKLTIEDMVRMGAQVPPDWVDFLADYLGEHLGPDLHSTIEGPDVSMVLVAANGGAGGIAATASPAPVAFSFDPKNGAIVRTNRSTGMEQHYPLPGMHSKPLRFATGSNESIWYLDTQGYIGRLDLATGQTQQWACLGGSSSQPDGIAVLEDSVWYVENRPRRLVRFNPGNGSFETWATPPGAGEISQIVAVPGGLSMSGTASNQTVVVTIRPSR